jgi:hypothetical protein
LNVHVGSSSANTDGITAGASKGSAISAPSASECVNRESGTVYHLRLPMEIDGRVTSPNRSRGMALSLCLIAMPGRVNAAVK